jgi:sugar lactone lactonase YvrE
LCLAGVASAGDVRTVVELDPAAGEFAEGVAAARHGEVYAGVSGQGRVIEVATDGSVSDVLQLELTEGDFGLTGLAIDPGSGWLYAAVNSSDPALHGVVSFSLHPGEDPVVEELYHVDGTETMAMPNAIAFADVGDVMYITDSASGQVWRSEWEGWVGWHMAELWLADPLLEGTGALPFPFPVGANGIAVDDGVVYVGVTEKSHVVGIPVEPDGSAGVPFVHLELSGISIDGIGITDDGDFVVADPPANTIWIIGEDGVPAVLADADDGISGPTSVHVDGSRDGQPVYVANMAQAVVGELARHGPSLMAIEMD